MTSDSKTNLEAGSYILPSDIPSELLLQQMAGREYIVASTGEYIIAPTVVRTFGNGDLEAGRRVLNEFVRKVRREQVESHDDPSWLDYSLADVDPDDEAEVLRATRERVKKDHGTPDDLLDKLYGLISRPK